VGDKMSPTERSIMYNKIKEILGSPRFWQIVVAGLVIWLETNDWKKGVLTILTGSVGVGTIDRFSEKIGKK